MGNITNRYPNFFILLGQFPLFASEGQHKQIHGLILQISALIEGFLADETLLDDVSDMPQEEAHLFLEFVKGNDTMLSTLAKMIPLANIKHIDSPDLQEAIQDFLALTRLYIIKNKEVITALENVCEDTTEFIRRHPATYQRLLKNLQTPTIAQTFEGNEFENFTQKFAV